MTVARTSEAGSPASVRRALLLLLGLVLVLGCLSGAVAAERSGALSDEALIAALRGGGYNLYVRHAATEWSQSDAVRKTGDWTSCDQRQMRQLSDAGRRDARDAGKAMRSLRVPIGAVHSSPYCRTVETARLMGLGEVETTEDLMNLRAADHVGGRAAVVARARARLASPPAPGSNSLFVAHGNLARAATEVYPGEGEALVFRPLGDAGFEFVGRLTPERWVRLADELGKRP